VILNYLHAPNKVFFQEPCSKLLGVLECVHALNSQRFDETGQSVRVVAHSAQLNKLWGKAPPPSARNDTSEPVTPTVGL